MNVLIIGNSQDAHAVYIKKTLSQTGAKVNYLDVSLFPTNLQMSWQPNSGDGYLKLSADEQWQLEDIKSVYWRNFNAVNIPQLNALPTDNSIERFNEYDPHYFQRFSSTLG